jgi:zinc protease
MMFQSSKHVPPTRTSSCSRRRRERLNGTTDYDRTNYFETVPSNQLELALWLESDRMGYLLDKSIRPRCRTSRTSCATSAAERREPAVRLPEKRSCSAVPEGTSVLRQRHRIARRHPGVEARRREAVLPQYYAPNNASVAIVGDIDTAQAKRWSRSTSAR